jgi:hypothetical protein
LPNTHTLRAYCLVAISLAVSLLLAPALSVGTALGAEPGEGEMFGPPAALLDEYQVVVHYGSPIAEGLGILGQSPPEEAASRLQDQTARFDELNGGRGALGAMEVIYGMALAEPGTEGTHVGYLDDDTVTRYIALAEERDLQLILDLQLGRADVSDEVARIERFLRHPRVHVAIDPEYAVGPWGVPIVDTGFVSGAEINEAQRVVSEIVRRENLPPKLLVIHQFMEETIIDGHDVERVPGVELVLNMDAYGDIESKLERYREFAHRPYAHRRSYNVFMQLDTRVQDERELLELDPLPDMFMYQ